MISKLKNSTVTFGFMINNAANTTVPIGELILILNSYSDALNCPINEETVKNSKLPKACM